MNILAILQENNLSDLFKFYTESRSGIVTHCVNTNQEALQRLDENPGVWPILVCDYSLSAKVLVPHFLKNKIQMHVQQVHA